MPQIHYVGGGIASGSAETLQPVLVKIPCTDVFRVTPTYANQVLSGYQIVMTLGDTKKIANAVMSDAGNSTLEERLGVQNELEEVREEVERLKANNYRRARPLLPLAQEGGLRNYEIERKIQSGEELTYREIDTLVDTVPALRRAARARSPIKDAVKDYIRSGEADNQTLFWLESIIDPAYKNTYKKLIEYDSLNAKIQQIDQAYTKLEQALVQSIDAIKSGNNYQDAIEFDGLIINVNEKLKQLIGTEPGRYFLFTIDEVVGGENKDGLIVPFQFNARNGTNVSEELKPYYMSVEKLFRMVSIFDEALGKLLAGSTGKMQEILDIYEKIVSSSGISIGKGVLMRSVYAKDHQPTLILYPDARIQIPGHEEQVERIMEIVGNRRAEIPGLASKFFGLPEEQIKFEEMISLQEQLMQLLPFPNYTCSDITSRFTMSMEQAKKHRARLAPKRRIQLAVYEANERQLQRDFAINISKLATTLPTKETLEETMQLFGDEYEFIQNLELRRE